MEEENKIVAEEVTEAPAEEAAPAEGENRGYEPHGSASAPRPGDRKYGNRKGRPSERRQGRGGFRGKTDDYAERVVHINRISKTTQGGKNVRFSALAVVGDGKGKYGFALSKSGEVPDAIKKALAKARKQMVSIEIVKGGTIAHDVEGKFGSTKVVLKPAKPGTGIVAGGAVRAILELAGMKNIVSKVYGSRAPINILRATDNGLKQLKRYDEVMLLRGLKTEEQLRAQKRAAAPAAPAEEKGE
ncbi:MAG: 30S ribosomal protein S5 [Bacilli bacterium]|nr:30S ribosomal protein S5 [Bacilli bacterium]